MIPLSVPEISGNEWKYIKECLDTGWVSSVGSYVNRFEEIVANYIGVKHAIAVVNGTSALHVALLALGIGPDDEVIVPTLTFIASVNVVRYCNANPVFTDCDPDTLCMDVQKVIDFLENECIKKKDGYTYNKKTNRKVKAIIPVHIFGHPVNMDPLLEITAKYNIKVIEDAAESIGSDYKGKKTGSLSDIGCLSFNGNKIVTTGGGGIVLTNNDEIAGYIKHLTTQAKTDHPYEYEHDEIGYNYRLTNIQAAMGVAQMEKLQNFIDIKRRNALIYRNLSEDIPEIDFLWEKDWAKSNFWFYTIKIKENHREPLLEYLISKKIQARPIWKLIHSLDIYKRNQAYNINEAYYIYNTSINLPCSVSLKEKDIQYIVQNIKNFFSNSS